MCDTLFEIYDRTQDFYRIIREQQQQKNTQNKWKKKKQIPIAVSHGLMQTNSKKYINKYTSI